MSSTLKQLRDLVIIDAGVESNPKFPTARLNKEINLAQRYVQIKLNGLGMKKWEARQALFLNVADFCGMSVRTVDLQNYLQDMLESPKSIKFLEVSNGAHTQNGIAFEISDVKFLEQLQNGFLAPTVLKPVFMRLAGYLYIAPSDVSIATAYYYKAVADLSNDASVTQIPAEFEEHIIKKATLEIKAMKGEAEDREMQILALDKQIQEAYEKFVGGQMEVRRQENNMQKLQ